MAQRTDAGYALVSINRFDITIPEEFEEDDLNQNELAHDGFVYLFEAVHECWLQSEMDDVDASDIFGDNMDALHAAMVELSHCVTVWKQISNYDPPNWTGGPNEWLTVKFVGVVDMNKLPLVVQP